MDDFIDLYQETIIAHSRNPRNYGPLEDANRSAVGYNASCGDDIRVHLKIIDGKIIAAHFTGEGCAISKASASIMIGAVEGTNVLQAKDLAQKIIASLSKSDVSIDQEDLGICAPLLGVRRFPMRVKCATLAWHALEEAVTF
ncbi:MAG: SUF system NifU family Fe-S cluster assembly protein [Puniceicoccales bacterium]|jgi:nitrogen fixation NifU-like protein|nr:SUF system NifU family Fe-S cluster assembly protein [Puniceicoccales bacterium]